MKAIWQDTIIAESQDTVVVENNHYFPKDALQEEYFIASQHTSVCPWKGTAEYYSIKIGNTINENAAWYYAEPKAAAAEIKNRVAFWKGVVVTE